MPGPLRPHLICIDGPAGAGKTTLAGRLHAAEPDSAVVHLDHLYDGWGDPLGEDFAQRLLDQVVEPWLAGSGPHYQRYDWEIGVFAEWVSLPYTRVLIIEGVGAGCAQVRRHASALYFLEVDPLAAWERVVARDGEHVAAHLEQWQRKEAAHFIANRTREAANIVLPAGSWTGSAAGDRGDD